MFQFRWPTTQSNYGDLIMKHFTVLTLFASLLSAFSLHAEPVVYQFKKVQPAVEKPLKQALKSNEYWMTISGKALKQGVELPFSAQNSFVRVAPKFDVANTQFVEPLDVSALSLTPNSKVLTKGNRAQVEQVFAQKEMNDAGFSDGSVALKVKSQNALQQLTLKTNQYLIDDAKYLVHVKEKYSDVVLAVAANNRSNQSANKLAYQSLSFTDNATQIKTMSAKLVSPTNEKVTVDIANNHFNFDKALAYFGAINGLYELELQIDAERANMPVKRSLKIPFVNFKQTAKALPNVTFSASQSHIEAKVPLMVNDAGRFSLQATLQGSNDGVRFYDIATVEMAKELNGDDSLSLPFTTQARYSSYRLNNMVLKDQSRLLVLQTPQKLFRPSI